MGDASGLYHFERDPDGAFPEGATPILVHGLEGYSDAGHAVRLATNHLRNSLDHEVLASFTIDSLLDYRSRRPTLTFTADHFSGYDEPRLDLLVVHDIDGDPFLMLAGLEPDLQWEKFIAAVIELAERFAVRSAVGLSAIPMAVPHTRPTGLTAHSSDRSLIAPEDRWGGELTVPSSASTLLEYRMGEHGMVSTGLSVHVPHYLAQTDFPAAARVMLDRIGTLGELNLPLAALDDAAEKIRERVDHHIEDNEEVQSLVTALEQQYDAFTAQRSQEQPLLASDQPLPSGDELGAEFERFLAERDDQEPGPDSL